MKIVSLIVLLSLASCALYEEIVGEPRPHPTSVSSTAENNQILTGQAKIIDEARIKSSDSKATLVVMKFSDGNFLSSIDLDEGLVNYKEGHSVELNIDGSPIMQKVQPTKQDDIVRFADELKLMESLKGKKLLKVELLMKKGKKYFDFDLEKVQKVINVSA
jgi:hypothetical protein